MAGRTAAVQGQPEPAQKQPKPERPAAAQTNQATEDQAEQGPQRAI